MKIILRIFFVCRRYCVSSISGHKNTFILFCNFRSSYYLNGNVYDILYVSGESCVIDLFKAHDGDDVQPFHRIILWKYFFRKWKQKIEKSFNLPKNILNKNSFLATTTTVAAATTPFNTILAASSAQNLKSTLLCTIITNILL